MSEVRGRRRVVAELTWGDPQNPVAFVGSRSVHHFWALLAPHFRTVWLAPHGRSDDRGVSWTWKEDGAASPATPAELTGLRQRLAGALTAWREDPAAESADAELAAVVARVATELLQKNDAGLAAFVCRTEAGLRVHSWGATVPARTFYPEDLHREVSGVLLVGDKDANALEVVLENPKGVVIARTQTNPAGAFVFRDVSEGSYRVRVLADRVDFPVHGLDVEVGRTSVTGLELRSTALNMSAEKRRAESASERGTFVPAEPGAQGDQPTPAARPVPARRRRRLIVAGWAGAGVLLGVAGWYFASGGEAERVPRADEPTASAGAREPEPARGSVQPAAAATLREPATSPRAEAAAASPADRPVAALVSRPEAAMRERVAAGAGRKREAEVTPRRHEDDDAPAVGVRWAAAGPGSADATNPAASSLRAGLAATDPAAESAATLDANRASPGSPAAADGTAGRGVEGGAGRPTAGPPRSDFGPRARPAAGAMAAVTPAGATAAQAESPAEVGVVAGPSAPRGARKAELLRASRVDTSEVPTPTANRRPDWQPRATPPGERRELTADRLASRRAPPAADKAERRESDPPVRTDEEVNAVAVATERPGVGAAATPIATAVPGLELRGPWRISAWRRSWSGDQIVPTVPVLAGEDDALEILRERLLRERRGRMPLTLAEPLTWHGVVLTVPAAWGAEVQWRIPAEMMGVEAAVRDGRAEIGWRVPAQGGEAEFRLENAAGDRVACVQLRREGWVAVAALPGSEVVAWLGLECAAGESDAATTADRRPRFEWWQGIRGALPAEWRSDPAWRGGRGRRLEFPVGTRFPPRAVVLHDAETDWTLGCVLEVR